MNGTPHSLTRATLRRTLSDLAGPARQSSARLINWPGTFADLVRTPLPRLKLLRHLVTLAADVGSGTLVSVPTRLCMDVYAYSFGDPAGWHYYRDLVGQLLENPGIAPEDTRYFRFLRSLRAPSFTDMISFHDPELRRTLPVLPYGSYPWGTYEWRAVPLDTDGFYDRSSLRGRATADGRPEYPELMFGEDSTETRAILRRDFRKLESLVRSFQRHGYRPLRGQFFFPTVGTLVAESGEIRFLLKDGTHRIGVLAALGCDRVFVRVDARRFPPVRESAVEEWLWVRRGLLSPDEARRMFSLYFSLNGSERRRALLPEG